MVTQADIDDMDLEGLSRTELMAAVQVVRAQVTKRRYGLLESMYPDEGPLRRELYPKHMEFFAAGKKYNERLFMAGNRVGKTEGAGGYEAALHLTLEP